MVSSRSTALGMSWAARPQLWVLRAFSLILFILVAVISWPLWRDALEMNVLWASVHHAMAPSAYFVAPLASFEMLSTAMLTIVILVILGWECAPASGCARACNCHKRWPMAYPLHTKANIQYLRALTARCWLSPSGCCEGGQRGGGVKWGRFVGGPAPRVRRMQRIIPAGAPVRLSLRASLADAGCRLPPSTHRRRPG